ncbi:MAG: hypothetical protein JST89_16680 [Cyanobacteria bacterium SZAS-4]|nr:hypothetical protein [Cyanobacteria bacterium SZAS-4]
MRFSLSILAVIVIAQPVFAEESKPEKKQHRFTCDKLNYFRSSKTKASKKQKPVAKAETPEKTSLHKKSSKNQSFRERR